MGRRARQGDMGFTAALRTVVRLDAGGPRRVATVTERSVPLVYAWLRGASIPDPEQVFAIEQLYDLQRGELSHHLGYVPNEAAMDLRTALCEALARCAWLPATSEAPLHGP